MLTKLNTSQILGCFFEILGCFFEIIITLYKANRNKL